jgi:hypothetical protein
MDDHWNSGTVGGDTAQDSGLAAVGVHDVGAAGAEKARELAGGAQIEQGMDGPDERRDNGEEVRLGGNERFHGTFGAGGGAGDDIDLKIGLFAKAQDGSNRVFLRATDDEARDYVRNAHLEVAGARRLRRFMARHDFNAVNMPNSLKLCTLKRVNAALLTAALKASDSQASILSAWL